MYRKVFFKYVIPIIGITQIAISGFFFFASTKVSFNPETLFFLGVVFFLLGIANLIIGPFFYKREKQNEIVNE